MENIKNNRVWIYCRVAHPNERALQFQQEELCKYANTKGLEIVGVTAENGSGREMNRKGFQELMEVIRAERMDIVLVKSMDRIGRDMSTVMYCLDEMDEHEVQLMLSNNTSKSPKVVAYCRVGSAEQLN